MKSGGKKKYSGPVKGYVIGVDGGASKTEASLASLNGRILRSCLAGSSSLRNVGIKNAVENVAQSVKKVLSGIKKEKKILSVFIGLPSLEEEFKFKENVIKKELLKIREIRPIFKGKITIGSDQLVSFRSGTDEKEGVALGAGSGCFAHGWRNNREIKTCGWGYLSEMGSAFWVGQEALKNIWKEIDGRGPKTLITKLIFNELGIKNKEKIIEKIYSGNFLKTILSFSVLVDNASKKKDKIAGKILEEAGKELALSANTVIKKLKFQKIRFPLVLTGSMFGSEVLLKTVKKEIKKTAPKANFIRPDKKPVIGAVKLALEQI